MAGPTRGVYEQDTNILHLWYPEPVILDTPAKIAAFFEHVIADFIQGLPQKPYLLVSFDHVRVPPTMTEAYADGIKKVKPLVIATYRYAMPANYTGVAVSLANARISSHANIFPDEAAARAAIRHASAQI
jgi:hypothetical protein